MSQGRIAFLSVMAQSAIALLALVFIAFQLARERWIDKPMRGLVAIQTLLEFLVPAFFAFVALLPVQSRAFDVWQIGGVLAGVAGVIVAETITIYGLWNRPLDRFGQWQLWLQTVAFIEYGWILLFALTGNLACVSVAMIVLLLSGSYETWWFFAEKDVPKPRTYRPGDTVRLELDVEDPSGVALVQVYFGHTENNNAYIRMDKDLDNPQKDTVVLEHPVTENTPPGEYRCEWIYREDALGNGSSANRPELVFRVEGAGGDHETPEIRDARLS